MMRVKQVFSLLLCLVIAVFALSACSDAAAPADGTYSSTTTEATTEEEAAAPTDNVAIVTNESGVDIAGSGMSVAELTIFERKSDGTLVKETPLDALDLSETTDTIDGKQTKTLSASYKADKNTDNIFVSLICTTDGESAGVATTRLFARVNGDAEFLDNYMQEDGTVIPLRIAFSF